MDRSLLEFGTIVRSHQMGMDILRWMGLLKNKHAPTYRHCVRVALIGSQLGEAFRMSAPDVQRIALGCLLHDLGKIMIPNRILDAPGRLTVKEWELMKLHPSIGAELIVSMQAVSPEIIGAVRSHHERWDGKGYPEGLKGEEIPMIARICCVADAFDSMVTDRPYQNRKSPGAAMEELHIHASTQFDAAVVMRFGGMFEQIREMYQPAGAR
ncbi:MAG: hypothetical protein K0R57_5124 [Paenibacillaceae bacterium]|jgi:putative nucleotidyltransferase with HDIG domain|nr:hypothetical protein [Paenibacillaceae bacterium]